MVELLVAIAIVGLLMAVTVPGALNFYESIQYRQAVREVITTLGTARQRSLDTGRTLDVSFDLERNVIALGDDQQQLPDDFNLAVTTAAEVNRDGLGIIRFYPEGSSSGGDVVLESPTGRGVVISVDWLMGGLSQEPFDVP
ncbi:type II secretion system protein [Halioglobus maricola]|nr:type II secretion system protein [Halioglobus maricola]